jgi:SAM-dependent methyltransferase
MSIRVFHDAKRARTYREADESAVVSEGHRRLSQLLRELSSSFGHDISILDLGCGTGRYFHCLSHVKRLAGVDISLHMLKEARDPVLPEQIACRQIDLICADISAPALADGSFDFIYSIGVFIGRLAFGPTMCDRLFDLLKPEGKIFVTVADVSSGASEAAYTRLCEVIAQSRFARHEISRFGDASAPGPFDFYTCTAVKRANKTDGLDRPRSVYLSDDDRHSGDIVWRNVNLITPQISSLVPAGDTFVLVDDDVFRNELTIDRRAVPFTERHGQYWGPPADDMSAIQAIEERRRSGVSFVVFAWPAFWWLDYYSGLNRYLRSRFHCVLESELLIVFDLRT